MTNWRQYLEILKKMDPRVAVVLFTGLGIVATSSIVSNWHFDPVQAGRAGLYVLLFGAAAMLIAAVITEPNIKAVLSWFLALSMIAVLLVFFISTIWQDGRPFPPVPCLLSPAQLCKAVLDRQAERLYTPPPQIKAQPTPLPSLAVEGIDRTSYQVDVHFAGIIRREDVESMSSALHQSGWWMRPETIKRGGERTGAAAGFNEVRYGPEKDRPAAVLLAHELEQKNLTGADIISVHSSGVLPGQLEVWLSY